MASLATINTARLCDRRRACFACRAFTRREHLWGLGYCAAAAWSSKAASEPRMFSAMRMEPSQNALVDLLKREGYVRSARIEEAMRACDRRLYLPQGRSASAAYIDTPQLIGQGETISAPSMHSECLELLNEQLHPGAVVLDVGSGSGYLTAAMALLVGPTGRVLGIDKYPQLVEASLRSIGADHPELLEGGRVRLRAGNVLAAGELKGEGPFDAIHVGAAAAHLPEVLVEALRPGGRMVIPVGPVGQAQSLQVVDKDASGRVHKRNVLGVFYVPLTQPGHDRW